MKIWSMVYNFNIWIQISFWGDNGGCYQPERLIVNLSAFLVTDCQIMPKEVKKIKKFSIFELKLRGTPNILYIEGQIKYRRRNYVNNKKYL